MNRKNADKTSMGTSHNYIPQKGKNTSNVYLKINCPTINKKVKVKQQCQYFFFANLVRNYSILFVLFEISLASAGEGSLTSKSVGFRFSRI